MTHPPLNRSIDEVIATTHSVRPLAECVYCNLWAMWHVPMAETGATDTIAEGQ